MNKAQLIEKISEDQRVSKQTVERILNGVIDTIKAKVKANDYVKIVGFGTFLKTKRKARAGRNPQNGDAIKIPSRWAPKFRAGEDFKSNVN
jgi:DNA-binding protein HU-beta